MEGWVQASGAGPTPRAARTSEHVVPHFLGLEVLQPIQVLLSVVEVVLEGSVTVITEVPLPHGHIHICWGPCKTCDQAIEENFTNQSSGHRALS